MDKDKETFETWNKIASVYQDKFMEVDLYNETYNFICKSISKANAKILEIGCGPGNISKYLLTQRPDFDILGIDIAPNMIEFAKKNNPTANFMLMDSRKINTLKSKYDGIVGGFCLPYLSPEEGKELISSSYDLLNDDGLLYLSFVEGDPARSDFKTGSGGRVFFYYHPLETLIKQMRAAKFEEIRTTVVKFKKSETEFDLHTILTAKKKRINQ